MFFVTGLPRSRTYWMSVYLTTPQSFCYHDAIGICPTRSAFYTLLECPKTEIGNSDCGLFATDFQQRWPDAPTVIIQREPLEVLRSLAHQGLELQGDLPELMARSLDGLQGLRVDFNDLNDRIQEIHEYLIPSVPFDRKRAEKLIALNLQSPLSSGYNSYILEWV